MKKIMLLALALTACNGSDNKDNKGSGGALRATCRAPIADDHTVGGCRIRLVTPASCATVDLADGKTAEFAWTTDGTNCETPYKAYIAGNPVTKNEDGSLNNVKEIQINAREGFVSHSGGTVQASADDFDGLTSTDGTYDWTISSFHGSQPASQVISVRK